MTTTIYSQRFSGFYYGIFSHENVIESLTEYANDYDLDVWDLDFDFSEYNNFIGKEYSDSIAGIILEIIKKNGLNHNDVNIEFDSICSPKYYNFETDKVVMQVSYTEAFKNFVKYYLVKNKDAFTLYLKNNFTSYDGFISYHSNRYDDWLVNFDSDFDNVLVFLIDFIIENECDSEVFDNIEMEIYYNGYDVATEHIYEQLNNVINE